MNNDRRTEIISVINNLKDKLNGILRKVQRQHISNCERCCDYCPMCDNCDDCRLITLSQQLTRWTEKLDNMTGSSANDNSGSDSDY